MTRRIVVGTRGSKLALIQAESVVARLRRLLPGSEIVISRISTQGDKNQHVHLEEVDGTGFFVKELENALLQRDIDCAVHSLKDVPTELPDSLMLAAVPERLDPRDVLVSKGQKLIELPHNAKIGTGSLRRSLQLTAVRPDVQPAHIRGNVDGRIGKVDSGEYHALVTAAAALIRLGLRDRITEYFDTASFLPAVGQGALAIESRKGDREMNEILFALNDLKAWQSTSAERAFLATLGGGCQAPIAALASVDEGVLRIEGLVASPKRQKTLRDAQEGRAAEAIEIGKSLAKRLLDAGGGDFVEEAKRR